MAMGIGDDDTIKTEHDVATIRMKANMKNFGSGEADASSQVSHHFGHFPAPV